MAAPCDGDAGRIFCICSSLRMWGYRMLSVITGLGTAGIQAPYKTRIVPVPVPAGVSTQAHTGQVRFCSTRVLCCWRVRGDVTLPLDSHLHKPWIQQLDSAHITTTLLISPRQNISLPPTRCMYGVNEPRTHNASSLPRHKLNFTISPPVFLTCLCLPVSRKHSLISFEAPLPSR